MAADVQPADAMDRWRIECPHAHKVSSTGIGGGIVDSMSFRRMLVTSASRFRGASACQDDGGEGRRSTYRALLPRKG